MSIIAFQTPDVPHIQYLFPCIDDISKVIQKDVPKLSNGELVPHKIISRQSAPFKYSSSWTLVNGELEQDRDALLSLKMQEWRQLRLPLLLKLDTDFMKALEVKDEFRQNEIIAMKQVLRDITSVDLSNISDAELENHIPAVLLPTSESLKSKSKVGGTEETEETKVVPISIIVEKKLMSTSEPSSPESQSDHSLLKKHHPWSKKK